jgi:hypothetical protein
VDWNHSSRLHGLDGLSPVVIAEFGALLAQRTDAEECDVGPVSLEAVWLETRARVNEYRARSARRARMCDQERVALGHAVLLGPRGRAQRTFDEALELWVRRVFRQDQLNLESAEDHWFFEVGELHLIFA